MRHACDADGRLMELLLCVEDRFALDGRGLVLAPDAPLPSSGYPPALTVIVERPDGTRLLAEAELRLDHFRPGGYKLIVCLPALKKAHVPVGSRVWKA
ncbi:hypothetical protein CEE57_01690 [Stenotrophomonas maltophilia]|nr:hypothetical protein CEE57_01690 [Stenotrophomonas maltophilia]